MPDQDKPIVNRGQVTPVTTSEVDTFLAELKQRRSATSRGRLVFALDATASRQPTWDTACKLQAEMFREAGTIGGLDLQLVFYRGENSGQLAKTMSQIMCNAGHTQIEKVLIHTQKETKLLKVSALVFVGDAMEENPDVLAYEASKLGQVGVPVFMFQEGNDAEVRQVFKNIAHLTKGAYCRFDPGAAKQLAELLRAVAVFAAGGITALAARKDAGAVKLLSQMR